MNNISLRRAIDANGKGTLCVECSKEAMADAQKHVSALENGLFLRALL
jgi:hypothetical protein